MKRLRTVCRQRRKRRVSKQTLNLTSSLRQPRMNRTRVEKQKRKRRRGRKGQKKIPLMWCHPSQIHFLTRVCRQILRQTRKLSFRRRHHRLLLGTLIYLQSKCKLPPLPSNRPNLLIGTLFHTRVRPKLLPFRRSRHNLLLGALGCPQTNCNTLALRTCQTYKTQYLDPQTFKMLLVRTCLLHPPKPFLKITRETSRTSFSHFQMFSHSQTSTPPISIAGGAMAPI